MSMRKRGSIEAVIYFRNYADPAHPPGYVMLAPYSDFPTPRGYSREGAETLADARKLQAALIAQESAQSQDEYFRDEAAFGRRQQEIRDRLYAKMTSSATSPYERDFIREFLRLRDDKKADKYSAIFEQRAMYLHALENDAPRGRRDGEETFSPDRIG
jgi:hypothetical protein